ncbi:hypothetical protein [Ferrimonas sp. YFM]|uniref:hypothetical protein n=1 Tax=Ferrimonas sp. YFM TaxID=3028878 RepID=UPI002572401D|nr:hypothetical protein [Ferrimonas sp. YFM]BDY05010.1 hypothetical protein F0521_20510 [Ferrimonas sp. YFM]
MFDAIWREGEQQHLYSIISFEALSVEERESKRQKLFCPECHQPAFYRKASSHGRSACFGSRYHTQECTLERRTAQREKEEKDAKEVDRLLDQAVTPFSFEESPKGKADKPASTGNTRASSTTAKAGKPKPLTLTKALHSLLRDSDLGSSDALIELDKGYQFKAKNLFVPFSEAKAADSAKEARPKMFWGTLSHSDKEMQWLNPAGCQDVGIPIRRYRDQLLQRFGIEEREQLEGAGIILFGKCYWNQAKTRKIIELWNKDRIHLSLVVD